MKELAIAARHSHCVVRRQRVGATSLRSQDVTVWKLCGGTAIQTKLATYAPTRKMKEPLDELDSATLAVVGVRNPDWSYCAATLHPCRESVRYLNKLTRGWCLVCSEQSLGIPESSLTGRATSGRLFSFSELPSARLLLTDFLSSEPTEFLPETFATTTGAVKLLLGGFLIGFGTRYAGGCTSGHSITGISNLNWPSLVATVFFFAGGLAVTWGLGQWIL